jgi:hypothetical protein
MKITAEPESVGLDPSRLGRLADVPAGNALGLLGRH